MRHIRWAESNRIFQLGSTVLNGNNMLGAIAVICYSSTHFICRGATCSSQITLRTSFFVRGNIFYNWTSLVCQQDADFWHYPRNVALSFYYRHTHTHTHTTLLPLSGFFLGQPVWAGTRSNIYPFIILLSSVIPYLLRLCITIHDILPVQFTILTVFFHNLSPRFLSSTSWPGTSTSYSI